MGKLHIRRLMRSAARQRHDVIDRLLFDRYELTTDAASAEIPLPYLERIDRGDELPHPSGPATILDLSVLAWISLSVVAHRLCDRGLLAFEIDAAPIGANDLRIAIPPSIGCPFAIPIDVLEIMAPRIVADVLGVAVFPCLARREVADILAFWAPIRNLPTSARDDF